MSIQKLFFHEAELTTILVADDDDFTRRMITKMIVNMGYNVIEVENGQAAVDAYPIHNPELVLLDAMMPILNGFDACRILNETYGDACAPIMMVTALGDKQSIAQALEAGAFDYITKPFNTHILRNRISRLIDLWLAQRAIGERNRFLETVRHVSEAVNTTLERQTILETLAQALVRQLEATNAYVCDLNVHANSTTVLAAYINAAVTNNKSDEVGKTYSLTDHYPDTINLLFGSKNGYSIRQLDEIDITPQESAILDKYRVKTTLHLPLLHNNDILGYIVVWNTLEKYHFSEQQLKLAVAIANQATQAVHNANLYEQVNQAADELMIRNQELDAYNHTIAHDLKNPINLVMNYASLAALAAEGNPEVIQYTNQIQVAGRRMADMIDQLLLLSQVGDAADMFGTVDMVETAFLARSRFEHDIQEHHIHVKIMDDLPPAYGYAPWLEEVFANLIGNAIKYRDPQKMRHEIVIQAHGLNNNQVRYEVIDNGIGIPETEYIKLFQMFSRLESTPQDVQGFGLGLSIIKRIIDKLHGDVGVESVYGEGSTFWFVLPVVPTG